MASSASAAAEPRALSSWLTRPNLNPTRGGVAAGGVFVKKAGDYSMLAAYFAAQRPSAAGAASATDAMDDGAGGRADDSAAASTATAEVPAPPQVRYSALQALRGAFGSSSAASRGLKALGGSAVLLEIRPRVQPGRSAPDAAAPRRARHAPAGGANGACASARCSLRLRACARALARPARRAGPPVVPPLRTCASAAADSSRAAHARRSATKGPKRRIRSAAKQRQRAEPP